MSRELFALMMVIPAALIAIMVIAVGFMMTNMVRIIRWKIAKWQHPGDMYYDEIELTARFAEEGFIYLKRFPIYSRNDINCASVLPHGMWRSDFDKLMLLTRKISDDNLKCSILRDALLESGGFKTIKQICNVA